MEYRWAEGYPDRLPELAAHWRGHMDVIAWRHTSDHGRETAQTIPIVFTSAGLVVEKE
jgi:hypothetical protein